MIKKQACALMTVICLAVAPTASARQIVQPDMQLGTKHPALVPVVSQASVSGALRSEYLQACASFLKNDAALPCGCMLEAHSMGGAQTVSLMVSYYRGEIGIMKALEGVYSQSADVAARMEAALNQCPTSWTPDKGWH